MLSPSVIAKLDRNLQAYIDDIPVTIEFVRDAGANIQVANQILALKPNREVQTSQLTSAISTRCSLTELESIGSLPEVKIIRLRVDAQVTNSKGPVSNP